MKEYKRRAELNQPVSYTHLNDFRQAVQLGVSKVNIFTDIDKAGKAGVEAGIAAGERTMMGLIAYEIDAMKKVVAEKIRLFGSEGKAC